MLPLQPVSLPHYTVRSHRADPPLAPLVTRKLAAVASTRPTLEEARLAVPDRPLHLTPTAHPREEQVRAARHAMQFDGPRTLTLRASLRHRNARIGRPRHVRLLRDSVVLPFVAVQRVESNTSHPCSAFNG